MGQRKGENGSEKRGKWVRVKGKIGQSKGDGFPKVKYSSTY